MEGAITCMERVERGGYLVAYPGMEMGAADAAALGIGGDGRVAAAKAAKRKPAGKRGGEAGSAGEAEGGAE